MAEKLDNVYFLQPRVLTLTFGFWGDDLIAPDRIVRDSWFYSRPGNTGPLVVPYDAVITAIGVFPRKPLDTRAEIRLYQTYREEHLPPVLLTDLELLPGSTSATQTDIDISIAKGSNLGVYIEGQAWTPEVIVCIQKGT